MKTKNKGIILVVLGGLTAILGGHEILYAGRIIEAGVVLLLGSAICGIGAYTVWKFK